MLAASTAFAAKSLQLGTGITGASTMDGSAAPFRRADVLNQTQVFEFRLHGPSGGAIPILGSRQTLFTINGSSSFWIFVNSDGNMTVTNWYDSFSNGDGNDPIYVGDRSDILVRIVRKPSTMQYWVELWNIDGTGYRSGTVRLMSSLGDGPSSGGGSGTLSSVQLDGSTWTGAGLAWLRWQAGITISPNATPPKGTDSVAGYMAAYEFESGSSTSADSSTRNHPITFSGGTGAYVNTPTYAPGCSAGLQQTFQAGKRVTLDGSRSSPLNENSALIYQWQQTSGATTLSWSSHSVASPSIEGSVFGSYVLSLKVTDSDGLSSTCSVKHGFVATDSKGVILIPNPDHAKFFGALPGTSKGTAGGAVMFGTNPWPYFDSMAKLDADKLLSVMDTHFASTWDTPLAGTLSYGNSCTGNDPPIAQGSPGACTVITGIGTNFQHDFCSDGTTPENVNGQGTELTYILLWYRSSLYPGRSGRIVMPIRSCDSATQITLGRSANGDYWGVPTWPAYMDSNTTGIQYSRYDPNSSHWWQFNSAPGNYYDNVVGLYMMYYRSGIDDYLIGARKLADRWWTVPKMDMGSPYSPNISSGYWIFSEQRSKALAGMVLRALDGQSWMWPGLHIMISQRYWQNAGGMPGDLREDGYAQTWEAMDAAFNPDSTQRAASWAAVQSSLANKWTPYRQPDGSYNALNDGGGYSHVATGSPNSGPCCFTVYSGQAFLTNGSTAVTGTATNFALSWRWDGYTHTFADGIGGDAGCLARNVSIPWWNGLGGSVYYRSDTTEVGTPMPRNVYIDGVIGTKRNSLAAVVSYRDWYWSPVERTTLYVKGNGSAEPVVTMDVPGYIRFFDASETQLVTSTGANTGDAYAYLVDTVADNTNLTLLRPYAGTTGSKQYGCSHQLSWMGVGIQPFMLGIAGQGLWWSGFAADVNGDATKAATFRQYAAGVGQWLSTAAAYDSTAQGVYYASVFPTCASPTDRPTSCRGHGDGDGAMGLNVIESFHGYSLNYSINPSPTLKDLGDARYGRLWGKPSSGGLVENPLFIDAYEGGFGDASSLYFPKWFGFAFGVGANWTWPAARLGGLDPANNTSVPVSLGLPAAANPACTSWRLTVTDANGTASSPIACSTATCSVTADARQSGATLTASCLSSGGAPVRTINLPFQVQ